MFANFGRPFTSRGWLRFTPKSLGFKPKDQTKFLGVVVLGSLHGNRKLETENPKKFECCFGSLHGNWMSGFLHILLTAENP